MATKFNVKPGATYQVTRLEIQLYVTLYLSLLPPDGVQCVVQTLAGEGLAQKFD